MSHLYVAPKIRLSQGTSFRFHIFCQCRSGSVWQKAPVTRMRIREAKGFVKNEEWRKASELDFQKRSEENAKKAIIKEIQGGLIPLNVLSAAYKSGFLKVSPSKAAAILRDVNARGELVSGNHVRNIASGIVIFYTVSWPIHFPGDCFEG